MKFKLPDLLANTTYYYAVGYGSTQLRTPDFDHYFKTTPLTNTTQTIRAWVLGNAGNDHVDQTATRDAYYSYIGNNHTDLMLMLGDNAYNDGTDAEYQIAMFENMYQDKLINTVMWSCFGNRDGASADSDTESGPYYDIFTFPRLGEAGGVTSNTEAYYSFDYGNIHFISLNTWDVDRSVAGPMMTWLQSDLNANTQDWVVALFHHPPYNGTDGNSSDTDPIETDMREDFVPILEAAGVDLVLSSHHHSYQRSFLIKDHHDVSSTWNPATMGVDLGDGRDDGDNAYYKEIGGEGTVYMVAGSAGSLGGDPFGYPAMYSAIQELGSLVLEVSDLQMDVKFLQDDESIGDYFTIIKQINPPTVDITSPMDGAFYSSSPGNITINTTVSDPGGSVQQVEFFVNGSLIGTDNSDPFAFNWNNPADGTYEVKAVATDNDGNIATSKIKVQVGDGSVCTQINKSADDAEEAADGYVDKTNRDLELVNDGDNQTVGLRFENLNIPQGAVIMDAYIQFTVDEPTNINPRKLDIYAEDNDYPFSFQEDDFNISSRPKTSATVSWYPDFWNIDGESGPDQKTVQIRSVIQEVVNRSGFTMNSPIVIIIEGIGKRVAESFDGNAGDAPELCIEFSNCPDSDGDGTCDANDICAGLEPGDPCDDGNPATYNDLIQGDCSCAGTFFDCPSIPGDIGDPCNDNDVGTYNDVITAGCACQGTQYDCYPAPLDIGDSCNDNDVGTYNDVIDSNCECHGTQYDCYPSPNDIGDPCNDGDPGTHDDEYNASCVCAGIPYDCPILQKDFGEPCDDGDANTNNDEIASNCTCAGIPNGTGTLTSATISSGDNDAEEEVLSGDVSTGSSDLELIYDSPDDQIVGLRFTNLNIPQGMYIMSAMIQFTSDGSTQNIDPCRLDIYGEDINNSPDFTNGNGNNNISSRAKTTAKADWSPDQWNADLERGVQQRTVNIASVIQEIVNRPGYSSSSAISLLIEGTGKRKAFSYNGNSAQAATLTVIYDLTGPLPIELLDISAKTQRDAIRVDWSTASETNNDYFTIERSFDGRDFQAIGTVPGKGTTTDLSVYTFLDKNPERGINYYRVKQTDFDSQYSYSRVVNAKFEGENYFQIFPTIVEDYLTIHRSTENNLESTIIIHDITGRSFKTSVIENDEFEKELLLENFIPGVYFISIYNNESVETYKIIKL